MDTFLEILQVIGVLIVVGLLGYGLGWLFQRGREGRSPLPRPYVTLHEWQRGLVYRAGRFRRIAGPGRVWTFGLSDVVTVPVDEQLLSVEPTQMIAADRRPLAIGASVFYRVTDPRTAIETANDYRAALAVEVRGALQNIVSARSLAALIEEHRNLDSLLHAAIAPLAERRGLAINRVLIGAISVHPDILESIGFTEQPNIAPDTAKAY